MQDDDAFTMRPRVIGLGTWLEECPNLFVRLIRCPFGEEFPDETPQERQISSLNQNLCIGNLCRFLAECHQDNIWRSWQLYSDNLCINPVTYVPFEIDIDNEEGNLSDARLLTQDCLSLLERMDQFNGSDRLRIVFSGRKGFHVEGRPTAPLDYDSMRSTLIDKLIKPGRNTKGASNCCLDGTIDVGHAFIRVTGSLNSWRDNNTLKCRRVFQLSPDEFRAMSIFDIIRKSEAG